MISFFWKFRVSVSRRNDVLRGGRESFVRRSEHCFLRERLFSHLKRIGSVSTKKYHFEQERGPPKTGGVVTSAGPTAVSQGKIRVRGYMKKTLS